MPSNAAIGMVIPELGKNIKITAPVIAPAAPPMVNNGASVPPDVPLPRATAHDRNLKKHSRKTKSKGIVPDKMLMILS